MQPCFVGESVRSWRRAASAGEEIPHVLNRWRRPRPRWSRREEHTHQGSGQRRDAITGRKERRPVAPQDLCGRARVGFAGVVRQRLGRKYRSHPSPLCEGQPEAQPRANAAQSVGRGQGASGVDRRIAAEVLRGRRKGQRGGDQGVERGRVGEANEVGTHRRQRAEGRPSVHAAAKGRQVSCMGRAGRLERKLRPRGGRARMGGQAPVPSPGAREPESLLGPTKPVVRVEARRDDLVDRAPSYPGRCWTRCGAPEGRTRSRRVTSTWSERASSPARRGAGGGAAEMAILDLAIKGGGNERAG